MSMHPAPILRTLERHPRRASRLSSCFLHLRPACAGRPYSSQPQANSEPPRVQEDTRSRPIKRVPASPTPSSIEIRSKSYTIDSAWYNLTPTVLEATSRQLHLQRHHPLSITRNIIEQHFPAPRFTHYNNLTPVVSTQQNFDSLCFKSDHPGRQRSDTYYLNQTTLLRTHTSAHQLDTFCNNKSDGYLITADVYRRDEIDRSHYPVFHQVEGALTWDRDKLPNADVAKAAMQDLKNIMVPDVIIQDENPPFHAERNPAQLRHHTQAQVEAMGQHLKRSLEKMVVDIIMRARKAAHGAEDKHQEVRVRWVEAYFPFTTPSWELELFYDGDWHEVLGCGIIHQQILIDARVPSRIGWAFGIGLERIAMMLFDIPDIRLFWSKDERFLSQFESLSSSLDVLPRFVPFSKHPPCPKDVSFWLPRAETVEEGDAMGQSQWNDNDVMDLVRNVAGDVVEDVKLMDVWTSSKGEQSKMFRIIYRSLERTLTNEETNNYHENVRRALVEELGVKLR
ncbi:hypothetical protein CDD81_7679 [Ophiocordyceps australis]|uniref:Phenylalanine--tRNA ligase, mitochondrial n=1 Tax=Ophiocordyceps australis TaxID=1399860 RepID=A0A2C5XGP9_9HYPO|nr:hypothetical protein CDD81_7679 [Ophiocordyceps australis]